MHEEAYDCTRSLGKLDRHELVFCNLRRGLRRMTHCGRRLKLLNAEFLESDADPVSVASIICPRSEAAGSGSCVQPQGAGRADGDPQQTSLKPCRKISNAPQ
jgi:hypothetical protein